MLVFARRSMLPFDFGFVGRALGPHHRLSRTGSQDQQPQVVPPSVATSGTPVDPVGVPVPADDPWDVSDTESESTAPTLIVVDSSSSPEHSYESQTLALEDTSVFVLLGPG
jgi:hypothetical protein